MLAEFLIVGAIWVALSIFLGACWYVMRKLL